MRPLKVGDKVLCNGLPGIIRLIFDTGYASIVMHGEQKPGLSWVVKEEFVALESLTRRKLRYGGDGMLMHAAKDWDDIPEITNLMQD